jgi:hypothetical protein
VTFHDRNEAVTEIPLRFYSFYVCFLILMSTPRCGAGTGLCGSARPRSRRAPPPSECGVIGAPGSPLNGQFQMFSQPRRLNNTEQTCPTTTTTTTTE